MTSSPRCAGKPAAIPTTRTDTVGEFHPPAVGDLTLAYETLPVVVDAGLTFIAFRAEPGSPSCDALDLLANRAAAVDHEQGPPSRRRPTRVFLSRAATPANPSLQGCGPGRPRRAEGQREI